LNQLHKIASNFIIKDKIISIDEYGNGNINDSYLVTTSAKTKNKFILQKINTDIFHQPELLMQNINVVTEHIENKLVKNDKWQVFSVVKSQKGQSFWVSDKNSYWRMISFIEDSVSYDVIKSTEQASELGTALGVFHSLISDLQPTLLANVLEDFHITPSYLKHYDKVIDNLQKSNQEDIVFAHNFISENRSKTIALEQAKKNKHLSLRIIHGDPKMNNVMFHKSTGRAISIIDLDTVEPGLIHYDFGDCVRSSCNRLGEEAGEQWRTVSFDIDIFRNILKGYINEAKSFLTENDYQYLYDAIFIIAFELGLRFFTDYLEGNVYFSKIDHSKQNLYRGLTQFKLTESIKNNRTEIENIIQECKP